MITEIPLDEVVYFDVTTHHPTTQAVTDADSTPTFAVYEEATDTDVGVGGNLTKRTSLTGNYRGSFTASAANGFEVGKFYSVIASATVNSIAAKRVVTMFRLKAAESSAGVAKVDVTHFGGTAGTFASGLPSVDTIKISGDAAAADNAESFFDGTGYAGTGNTIPTVTTLTNDPAGVTTLLSRIPSALFSGITSLAQWLGLIAGKQTGNSTARTEIRATGAGSGTFDETTDSLEALRDRGDAAWITGTVVVVGQVPSGVGETTLRNYVGENKTWTIATVDENGTAVDLSALSLTITIEDEDGTTVQTIATGSITKTSTSISFTTSAASANAVITNTHKWACRNSSTSEVKLRGPYIVEYAAG